MDYSENSAIRLHLSRSINHHFDVSDRHHTKKIVLRIILNFINSSTLFERITTDLLSKESERVNLVNHTDLLIKFETHPQKCHLPSIIGQYSISSNVTLFVSECISPSSPPSSSSHYWHTKLGKHYSHSRNQWPGYTGRS